MVMVTSKQMKEELTLFLTNELTKYIEERSTPGYGIFGKNARVISDKNFIQIYDGNMRCFEIIIKQRL